MKRVPLKRLTPMKRGTSRLPRQRIVQGRKKVLDNEFTPGVRHQVKQRANFTCEFPACDRAITQIHHIWQRGKGGPGTIDNAMGLCDAHHAYVHAHPGESYERGWLRRPPPRG